MELHKIESLIDRYLEGKTSLSEEKQLQAYFSSSEVAPQLVTYKPLFSFFENERATEHPKLLKNKPPNQRKTAYTWITSMAGTAAAILIFWFSFNTNSYESESKTVHYDIAMQNTQDLLSMMANAISDGQKQLNYLKEFDHTKNQLIHKKENP